VGVGGLVAALVEVAAPDRTGEGLSIGAKREKGRVKASVQISGTVISGSTRGAGWPEPGSPRRRPR